MFVIVIQETPDPNVTPAVTSTPEPYIDGNTLLYYNPNGGKLYHLDPNCKIINPKFLPLGGTFTYSQIENELIQCNDQNREIGN